MCADPLMCAPTMFPNHRGIYKYRPAWRARQAEILALAMTGYKKKMKARRFETLHDTTLWKVHKPTRVLQSIEFSDADAEPEGDTPETKARRRMLQIDVQRWIRSVIRYYRENAPAESPCNYGSTEFSRSLAVLSGTMISYICRSGNPCSKLNTSSTSRSQLMQKTSPWRN